MAEADDLLLEEWLGVLVELWTAAGKPLEPGLACGKHMYLTLQITQSHLAYVGTFRQFLSRNLELS